MINNIPIFNNSETIQAVKNKIDNIYKQIKVNEIKPNTDYLFTGLNSGNLEKRIHRRYEYLSKYNEKNLKYKFIAGKSGLWFAYKEWCKILDKEKSAVNDFQDTAYLNPNISLISCKEIN